MPKPLRIPSYRHHKATGQAVVTVAGRDIYLGKYNTAASRAEYSRIIAEWTANGGTLPKQQANDLTVVELSAAFLRHAKGYYRRPDGSPSNEYKNFALAIRRLTAIYARTLAADFGPLALRAIRERCIEEKLARRTINHAINRIRDVFKWGVERELVTPSVLQGLQAVAGLRFGRSDAKETAPIKPVPDAFVDAVLPHVSPQVAAMIELQRITGMRSGEVTIMRGVDINISGKVWIYTLDRLAPVIGLLSVLAVRLLQLKMVARKNPEQAAAQVVPANWLSALPLLLKRRAPTKTVREFFRGLASLGGFLSRKGDGEPGWQTIWGGLETLLLCLRGAESLGKKCG